MAISRYYTEKKAGFDVEAKSVQRELHGFLGISGLESVRILSRYDVEGISASVCEAAKDTVFTEPQTDLFYSEIPPDLGKPSGTLIIEALPGQYDQRADSCLQCLQLLSTAKQDGGSSARPVVQTAKLYVFYGDVSDGDMENIRGFLINPVESREALSGKPETLTVIHPEPKPVETIHGFIEADDSKLQEYLEDYSLAMDMGDLNLLLSYFRDTEKRDPTVAELRVLDTYWSDHCRHTTFFTHISDVAIDDPEVMAAYEAYIDARREVYGDAASTRPQTLMDIATIASKVFRSRGMLTNIEASEEVNACSIHIDAEVNGITEDWLLMFKNETHNHPTEVEPFGGASTCVGGAIRDPLSGRAYVYQGMRITGAGDPRAPIEDTIPGKLPQKKLTLTAARGNSSYGYQVGLSAGFLHEIYHPGYIAKRMELGALVGAVKSENIIRGTPAPGDKIILLGGRTGRDGIGGATGSSKSQTAESIVSMSSEVQKGNALEGRRIQRLFLDPEVTKIIKRCNDFGAGGVSVAVGELAAGLEIDLSLVRTKYDGLNGTEIAISESQERMAVVVAPTDVETFIRKAYGEGLEAYVIAEVTESPRMVMRFNGKVIVDISRELLSTNGAVKYTSVRVPHLSPSAPSSLLPSPSERMRALVTDLRYCSQRGLYEMFDGSVGASGILMKNGGKTQSTPIQVMASLLPVRYDADTSTCSVMAYSYDPWLSSENPYRGAKTAVVTSVAKLVAAGCGPSAVYLTFQEYFERLSGDPVRWGKPFSALLGAFEAQMGLGLAAIGGKDSMSGSFNDIDVPPTLVSFAIVPGDATNIITPEFKKAGHDVVIFEADKDLGKTKAMWEMIHSLVKDETIVSAWAVTDGGVGEGIFKMTLGNDIGFEYALDPDAGFSAAHSPGSIIAEIVRPVGDAVLIGYTIPEQVIKLTDDALSIAELKDSWESVLEDVFPTRTDCTDSVNRLSFDVCVQTPVNSEFRMTSEVSAAVELARTWSNERSHHEEVIPNSEFKFAKPRALILTLPGTTGELDVARAIYRAGGVPNIVVVSNLTQQMTEDSIVRVEKAIKESQIVILPGGPSLGDEPDGAAKFLNLFLRVPCLADAVHEHAKYRGGLILGICNGFQALLKLGLVPFGEIIQADAKRPTLSQNLIGRHQTGYVFTRVASVNSPWMNMCNVGDVHAIAVSHSEGRFTATEEMLTQLANGGQIATQYTDMDGKPAMDPPMNPNGSQMSIEGLFSPDGRIFGKIGHTERHGKYVAKNIYGNKHQPVFESGVNYFR